MQVLVNEDARCVVDGVEYHAKTSNDCSACAGDYTIGEDSALCDALGPCSWPARADRTSIIWVKAE